VSTPPDQTQTPYASAVAGYADWIGQRWFVLPNPTYGSWEPALFNNEWSKPERERRAEKQKQFRY